MLRHIVQPFEPVFDEHASLLILGSIPSVKSVENGFYYGHPRNRFWTMLASVLGEPTPETVEQKKQLLLTHRIALWDVIGACDLNGSSDASVKNVVFADIEQLICHCPIEKIVCNGKLAGKLLQQYCKAHESVRRIQSEVLPSTSPANASCSLNMLTESWQQAVIR